MVLFCRMLEFSHVNRYEICRPVNSFNYECIQHTKSVSISFFFSFFLSSTQWINELWSGYTLRYMFFFLHFSFTNSFTIPYLHTTIHKKLKRHPFLYLNVHLGTHQEWVNRKIIRLDHERKVYGTILICIILSFELDLLSLKLNWMYVNNMIKMLATNAALLLVCVCFIIFVDCVIWHAS